MEISLSRNITVPPSNAVPRLKSIQQDLKGQCHKNFGLFSLIFFPSALTNTARSQKRKFSENQKMTGIERGVEHHADLHSAESESALTNTALNFAGINIVFAGLSLP